MRRLLCIRCGQPVNVREGIWSGDRFVEREYIDPARFVGGCCLEPSDQLPLEGEREETRPYDPAIARIPF